MKGVKAQTKSRVTSITILVIDDDEGLNRIIQRRLQRIGLRTEGVFNGIDAVERIDKGNDLLLLMDYRLPDMTAKDIISILEKKRHTVPFVVMTGFGDEKIAVEMMKLGAKDYIVKDGNFIDMLPHVVKRVLNEIEKEKRLARAEEEKERIRAQLLHAQKMEAIGTLAGGIAHDFNNLLTALSGYSQLALNYLDEGRSVREELVKILKIGEKAASLTNQLLAFSRRQILQKEIVNPNDIVSDLEKILYRLVGEDIELITNSYLDVGYVMTDPAQIQQIIMNLVVNARDAMPEGGRIEINIENVVINKEYCKKYSYAKCGKFVCISVSDTGKGIDKEAIDHIFEPFFTTKAEGKGTGLGLSVVYGIVKQHGGWINVFSEPGKGSTFRIYFPLADSKPNSSKEERIPLSYQIKGKSERILVVEDQDDVRTTALEAFHENGYVAFGASTAKEALDIFEKQKRDIHLVFCDVVLPDRSGLKLVNELLGRKPDIGILMSSGYSDEKAQWETISKKGIHFIQKPYPLSTLLRAVRKVIDSRSVKKV